MIDTLIVLAKEPRPGHAKTRLTPPLTPDQAAGVARACLLDTLAAADLIPARRRLLAFDRDARQWTPQGWDACRQPQGGLDVRLVAAFEAAGTGSALLVGMDTPQLRPADVAAFDPDRHDAALGHAADGGYWAIGLRDARQARAAITGVPMSTDTTGEVQLARLRALGLEVELLPGLTDIDTVDDLVEVASGVPLGRLGRAAAELPQLLLRAG